MWHEMISPDIPLLSPGGLGSLKYVPRVETDIITTSDRRLPSLPIFHKVEYYYQYHILRSPVFPDAQYTCCCLLFVLHRHW